MKNRLKNWAIKKLGGKTKEEFFQAVKGPNGPKIQEEHRKVVPLRAYIRTGWDCNFTEKEIKDLLAAEIMRKIKEKMKVSSQKVPTAWPVRSDFDLDTVHCAQILVVEDEEQ